MDANTIQLFTYAAVVLGIVFIPLLAVDVGASYFEVGLIVAAYNLTLFLSSYTFGRASDIYGRRLLLRLGLLISAFSFFLQIFADSILSLMLLRALVGFCIGIYPPVLTAYVYERKKSLGKFSAYGSLGWALGSFLAGVIALYDQIFIAGSGMLFLAFLVSLRLPDTRTKRVYVPLFPTRLIWENLLLYLPFLLRHTGALAVWAIFPLFLMNLGADRFWIGIIYSINSLTQFFIMRKLDRFDGVSLFRAGIVLSALAFFSFGVVQNYYQTIPIQIVIGVSWSCIYVGSLLFLTGRNMERATSIGILNSIMAFSGILGPIFGGIISEFLGLRGVMFFAALLTLIGFGINSLLRKNVRLRGGALPERGL